MYDSGRNWIHLGSKHHPLGLKFGKNHFISPFSGFDVGNYAPHPENEDFRSNLYIFAESITFLHSDHLT